MNIGNGLLIATVITLTISLVLFAVKTINEYKNTPLKKEQLLTGKLFYYISSLFIFFLVLFLITAFLRNDFHYAYVFKHSSRDLPVFYKIAALWAGQEGSFLLWLFILNLLGLFALKTKDKDENILICLVIIVELFILLSVLMESPFAFVEGKMPLDGQGMNRILMNPWMIAHPPVLYIGYASATILYAYGIAALAKKEYGDWIEKAYPWTVFSMLTLGIGIFMGGYWSYTVLGWGGYWGWDPVENSSLVPWLVVVVLMHTMLLYKKRGMLARTSVALAIIYFILVFYSTFLTRSGILVNFSVHSFSGSSGSRLLIYFILFFVLLVIISSFFKKKTPQTGDRHVITDGFGEKTYIQGMLVLLIFSGVILLATSLPIITGLTGRPYSMKTAKYNEISFFFSLILLVYMIFSTTVMNRGLCRPRVVIFIMAASLAMGVVFNLFITRDIRAYLLSIISFYLILYHGYELLISKSFSIFYSRLAHVGVAVMVIGIISSNFHSKTIETKLVRNREKRINDIHLVFEGLTREKKSKAVFRLRTGDRTENISVDYYIDKRMGNLYREPYICYGLFRDIYITPKDYFSGMEKATTLVLKKGEQKKLGNLLVAFKGFKVEKMTTKQPVVVIKLVIDGRTVNLTNTKNGMPVKFKNDIPRTDRYAALYDMDANKKIIGLYISPGKKTSIPPDSMLVEVSYKRLIWFVWLGTVLISLAGAMLLVKHVRIKKA